MKQYIVLAVVAVLGVSLLQAAKTSYTYKLADEFQKYDKIVAQALDELAKRTKCITFTENKNSADIQYVRASNRYSCYSYLGIIQNHKIFMNDFCFTKPIIQKEMIIALGFHQKHPGMDGGNIAKINAKYC